jgi:hypothetical protein
MKNNGTYMTKNFALAEGQENKASPRPCRGRNGSPQRNDERGSSLILALIYIVAIGMIVGALADWAMNDLTNTTHFQNANSLDNAISGATEVAIQSIRYYPNYANTNPNYGACWNISGSTWASDVTINKDIVAVWCSTVEKLKSPNTRAVTFIACPETAAALSTQTGAAAAESACQAKPALLAAVTFDDYPSGGGGLLSQTCSGGQGVCGFAATTTQWSWAS